MKIKKGWHISPLGVTNLVLFVFLLGAVFSPFAGGCTERNQLVYAQEENPLLNSRSVAEAVTLQEALREIYQEVNPSVVRIETEQTVKMNPMFNDPFFRRFFGAPNGGQPRKRQGLGSGFIINKEGYIVTNDHVVRGVDKITVKLQNKESYEAKLIGSDQVSDIALLKIEAKNLHPVYMGDSDDIRVGDFGIAIGNPFGLQSTFTLGVISSTGQDIETADGVARIQTDAAINPGNSGGPLLNIKGEVIGINQMIYTQSGGSVGIGFAIPINYAKVVIENIKSGKTIKPGYIGVAISPSLSAKQRKKLGLNKKVVGLLVSHVEVGSPAWESGLRPYDFITHIDGKVAEKFSILKSTVMRKGAGGKIKLKIIREKKKIPLELEIGEAPSR